MLISREIFRQVIGSEPAGLPDFETARGWIALRGAREVNLNLTRSCQGAREKKLNVINFQSDFFAQFAAHGFLRLFALVEKATRNSPAAVRTKFMFEQQDAALFIEHKRARRNRKSPLPETHQPATEGARKITKNRAENFREHERRIACS